VQDRVDQLTSVDTVDWSLSALMLSGRMRMNCWRRDGVLMQLKPEGQKVPASELTPHPHPPSEACSH